MKLKKGFDKHFDEQLKIWHIMPINGRKHYLDNCWCNPIENKVNSTFAHYFVETNTAKCEDKYNG